MKKSELLKATKEVKNILGFEDLNEKGSVAEMTAGLTEIAEQIGADGEDGIDEEELEDLSAKSKELLLSLVPKEEEAEEEAEEETEEEAEEETEEETEEEKPKMKKSYSKKGLDKKSGGKKSKKAKAKKEEADEDELVTKINEADLVELKALIKEQGKEVFPVASRGMPLQKNLEKLQAKALNDLSGEPVEVPEKKVKKATQLSAIKIIQLETCKNDSITVAQLIEKLESAGHNSAESYVIMRRKEVLMIIDTLKDLGKL